MKWKNRSHEFDDVYSNIVSQRSKGFIIWGYGYYGKKFYDRFNKILPIVEIWDEDIIEETNDGITVRYPDISNASFPIIVTAVSKYDEIKNKLKNTGLIENKEFYQGQLFNNVFFAYETNNVFIERVDISITKRCSLKCQKCNMFMPFYEKPDDKTKEQILNDLELLFRHVSHVDQLDILGGEPFLHPDLEEIVLEILSLYSNRIDLIYVVSNGTVVPQNDVLKALSSDKKVVVSLSDYTGEICELKNRFNQVIHVFENKGVRYVVDKNDFWKDFGFPDCVETMDKESLIYHFDSCNPPFRGLDDGKFFQCHIESSAIHAKLYNPEVKFFRHMCDFVDLSMDVDPKTFIEYNYGFSYEGYLSLCRYCKGCGEDNDTKVSVAKQK